MVHCFLWRITSDSTLTTGTKEAQKVFFTFVAQRETAITADLYLEAVIPGHLCHNFAYHFAVVAPWPTLINQLADIGLLCPFQSWN
jgi:hypothetical protein